MCIIQNRSVQQNRSVHGTVPFTERWNLSINNNSITIWCALYVTVPFTEPFRSRNRSVHGTVPFADAFSTRNRSVLGNVPCILRQKRRYIYISIDICSWTFGVHITEPFRSRNHSVYRTVLFTEPFRIFYDKSADTYVYKCEYM